MVDEPGREPRRHEQFHAGMVNAADHGGMAETVAAEQAMPTPARHGGQWRGRYAACQKQRKFTRRQASGDSDVARGEEAWNCVAGTSQSGTWVSVVLPQLMKIETRRRSALETSSFLAVGEGIVSAIDIE